MYIYIYIYIYISDQRRLVDVEEGARGDAVLNLGSYRGYYIIIAINSISTSIIISSSSSGSTIIYNVIRNHTNNSRSEPRPAGADCAGRTVATIKKRGS